MISTLTEMLSYPFLVRALIVGLLVALCASLLGVSLVLKRFSMIGDGLSHVGFGALAIAAAANIAPLYLAIPVCIAASFLLLRMSESTRIKGDAAIAMLSAGSLAIGVMVVSMTTGMNTDVYNYMFGSILSLSQGDAVLSVVLSAVVLVLFVLFYPRLFAVTFRRVVCPRNGNSHARVQRRARDALLHHRRARHADDGRAAHLQPRDLSGAHGDARWQAVSERNDSLRHRRHRRVLPRHGHQLRLRNAKRGKRRLRQHCVVRFVRHRRRHSQRGKKELEPAFKRKARAEKSVRAF